MAFSLKPSEEVMATAASIAIVYAIFSAEAPNMADLKNANTQAQGTYHGIHGSVRTTVVTSAAAISALALVARSPMVFVVGGLATVAEGWRYYHANAHNPATGKTTVPPPPAQSSNNGQ